MCSLFAWRKCRKWGSEQSAVCRRFKPGTYRIREQPYVLRQLAGNLRFFIPCIFYICYNKNYQQMRLFVLCLYFLFLVFSLHVSGLHGPIIRGISSCCFYATIWFMQCFVDRLRASAEWFVVVTSTPKSPSQTSPLTHADDEQSTAWTKC